MTGLRPPRPARSTGGRGDPPGRAGPLRVRQRGRAGAPRAARGDRTRDARRGGGAGRGAGCGGGGGCAAGMTGARQGGRAVPAPATPRGVRRRPGPLRGAGQGVDEYCQHGVELDQRRAVLDPHHGLGVQEGVDHDPHVVPDQAGDKVQHARALPDRPCARAQHLELAVSRLPSPPRGVYFDVDAGVVRAERDDLVLGIAVLFLVDLFLVRHDDRVGLRGVAAPGDHGFRDALAPARNKLLLGIAGVPVVGARHEVRGAGFLQDPDDPGVEELAVRHDRPQPHSALPAGADQRLDEPAVVVAGGDRPPTADYKEPRPCDPFLSRGMRSLAAVRWLSHS